MTDAFVHLSSVGSGSYLPEDVLFLLQAVDLEVTGVREKEWLIQSGQKHYSQMISLETAPSDIHTSLYQKAVQQHALRMATDVQSLVLALNQACKGSSIALVSFVRAGLPLGVLLRRGLRDLQRDTRHYGISIVRDRGIDMIALEAVIAVHGAENIVFVDGWTGKGAICGEVRRSLRDDVRFAGRPKLVVLADPCGRAWMAASAEDWLIPSGILGATVSGLVSRSIWPSEGGLHGCVVYDHLREHDVTRDFIDQIEGVRQTLPKVEAACPWTQMQRIELQVTADYAIDCIANRFGISNLNRIKPGIAEATRAVLRRVPDQVLVRDRCDPDVQLLMHLTEHAGVPVEEVGATLGPYRAVTVIRSAG